MLSSKFNSYSFLIKGVICILTAILIFTLGNKFFEYILYIIGAQLIFFAIINLLTFSTKKQKKQRFLHISIKAIFDITCGFFVLSFSDFIINSFTIISGIYLLAHSIIHLVNLILYIKNDITGSFKILFQFVFTLILALLLISNPTKNIIYAELIISVFFFFYGLDSIGSFLLDITPQKTINKYKSRFHITLPIFMNCLIPEKLIHLANKNLKINNPSILTSIKGTVPDIEVFIHLSDKGASKFGHVELCFEGRVISYGNYDNHSRDLFDAIGDGVILIADRESYIKYAVFNKERMIAAFGIRLTESERETIRYKITKLLTVDTVDWYPDMQLMEIKNKKSVVCEDMSSQLYKLANAKYKKIIKGKNKKFFVLKTNCAMVTESILSSTGTRILHLNGLITPGAYYEYLNEEFLRKNSNIITRKIYTKYDFPEKKE